MQLPRPPARRNGEQIAPLIDVVFLLLIFFMLVGVIAPLEPFEVEPPDAERAAPIETGPLVILLAGDGRLAFEGQALDLPVLASRLSDRLAQENNAVDEQATAASVELKVELKADAAVDSGKIIAVFDALREVGVEQVSLLTVQQRP